MDLAPPTTIGLIGGGLASYWAARTLRKLGYDGRLLLVGEEPHAPYDRPPLSKDVLTGAMTAEQTRLLDEGQAAELQVDVVLGERVTRLDARGGEFELASGPRVSVDRVLLATGGRARALPIPGADLPEVAVLRTRQDAEKVRKLAAAGAPVAVVGGGFLGLEVAASARSLGAEVTVVEAAGRLLARVLPATNSEHVARAHRAAGIRLEVGAGLADIVGDGRVRAVVLTDGRHVPASCVVVGIGMVPAVELAQDAGIKVRDGILTDAGGQTSNPHVFAAGDVACSPDPWYGECLRVEQWQSAQVQGIAAAHAMLGFKPPDPPVPWFWSDQGSVRLQVVGVPANGREVVHRGSPDDGDHCTLHLAEGRVVAAVAVGRPQDARGATRLIEAGLVLEPALLADKATDLRRLARDLAPA